MSGGLLRPRPEQHRKRRGAHRARPRRIHPEVQFDNNYESRFRKGQGKSGEQAVTKAAPSQASARGTVASVAAPVATAVACAEPEVNFVPLPPIDSWKIPLRCLKCRNKAHDEPVSNFMIGNVIFCPHCYKSIVVRDNFQFSNPHPFERLLRQMGAGAKRIH